MLRFKARNEKGYSPILTHGGHEYFGRLFKLKL